MSRLDRIYSQAELTQLLYEWTAEPCQVPTDHKLVTVRYAPADSPFIRKGRWSWPLGLLNDTKLGKQIKEIGLNIEERMTNLHPGDRTSNPQTLWEEFKTTIKMEAMTATKTQIPKINKRINDLKKDLATQLRAENIDLEENSRWNIIALEKEIEHLE